MFKNKDLADTYDLLADKGVTPLYEGGLAKEIVDAVRKPPTTASTDLPVPPGFLKKRDLRDYRVLEQKPTKVGYRGYDVYGMAPSSSGGSTVGEALNILERYDLGALPVLSAMHLYLEASALAYADRGAYVGDPAYVDVPLKTLLDDTFAAERACGINPAAGGAEAGRGRLGDGVRRRLPDARGLARSRRGHRERVDHQPHGGRQVGQRRRVHAHHRADRRLRASWCRVGGSCSTTS